MQLHTKAWKCNFHMSKSIDKVGTTAVYSMKMNFPLNFYRKLHMKIALWGFRSYVARCMHTDEMGQTDRQKARLCNTPTWHGPDFTCNFPQTVLRPIETDQLQIYPKPLLCFDSHLLVNISRCSSQHLSVISKHCLCLQLELRPTGTPVRLNNPDYPGLKTQTLPDHRLKNARWGDNLLQPVRFW